MDNADKMLPQLKKYVAKALSSGISLTCVSCRYSAETHCPFVVLTDYVTTVAFDIRDPATYWNTETKYWERADRTANVVVEENTEIVKSLRYIIFACAMHRLLEAGVIEVT